jgi:Helix-turn-helix domain
MPVLQATSTVPPIHQFPVENKILFTREESAEILRISVRLLDTLLRDGVIKYKRIGGPVRGRVLIPRAELLRFAEGTTS